MLPTRGYVGLGHVPRPVGGGAFVVSKLRLSCEEMPIGPCHYWLAVILEPHAASVFRTKQIQRLDIGPWLTRALLRLWTRRRSLHATCVCRQPQESTLRSISPSKCAWQAYGADACALTTATTSSLPRSETTRRRTLQRVACSHDAEAGGDMHLFQTR